MTYIQLPSVLAPPCQLAEFTSAAAACHCTLATFELSFEWHVQDKLQLASKVLKGFIPPINPSCLLRGCGPHRL